MTTELQAAANEISYKEGTVQVTNTTVADLNSIRACYYKLKFLQDPVDRIEKIITDLEAECKAQAKTIEGLDSKLAELEQLCKDAQGHIALAVFEAKNSRPAAANLHLDQAIGLLDKVICPKTSEEIKP